MRNREVRELLKCEDRQMFENLYHLAPPLERIELERATGEGMPEPECEGTTTEQVTDGDEQD